MSEQLLFELLNQGTSLIWPTQRAQELLFDLGERKSYSAEARLEAVEECVSWWEGWGLGSCGSTSCEFLSWPSIRSSLELSEKETNVGVAKDLGGLASLVGLSAKTLANNLSESKWYECKRNEHRWILFLGRSLEADGFPKGFLYHRRSIASFSLALAHSHGHLQTGQLDSSDALLLFTLISLWQRRRPTEKVRSNRKQSNSRRNTPKPIVGLAGTLLEPGLFEPNLHYLLERKAIHALPLLFELALTEAHLVPHPQRANGSNEPVTSLHWLKLIEETLKRSDVRALLGEESEFFQYRIDLMKAYQNKHLPSTPPDSIAEHPYISSTWLLSQGYWAKKNGNEIDAFIAALREFQSEEDWEGKAMQIPQINNKLERIPK